MTATKPSKIAMLERLGRKIIRLNNLRNACFTISPKKERVEILTHVPGTERLSMVKITIEPQRMLDMNPKHGTYNKGIEHGYKARNQDDS